jgi:hypothetical protein
MTYVVYRSQASASLRRIPMWLVGSDGTSPATGESGGQPQINWVPRGTATVNTTNTLSLVSANAGEYYVELTASEVSALGAAKVHYRSANAIANSTPLEIVNYDSGDSVRLGQFALPNAAADASGGLPLKGTEHSDFTVMLVDNVTYSGVTIKGIENDSVMTIAGTVNTATLINALNDIDGSAVTLHAGTHSNVTILGVTRADSVTNNVSADVVQISGDGTAADNLELAFDGTGYDSKLTTLSATGATAASVADAVWDEARTDHVALGSFGLANQMASSDSVTRGGSTSVVTLGSGETVADDVHNGAFIMFPVGSVEERTAGRARQQCDLCHLSGDGSNRSIDGDNRLRADGDQRRQRLQCGLEATGP